MRRYFDLDRWIPDHLRQQGGEPLRKARVAIGYVVALQLACALYFVIYMLEGADLILCSLFAVGGVSLLATPRLLALQRDPLFWTAVLIATATTVVLAGTAYFTGGLFASALWYLTLVPVLALLISGTRLAATTLGLVVVVGAAFYWGTVEGHAFPTGMSPHEQLDVTLTDLTILALIHFVFARLFEVEKDRARKALETRNDEMALVLDNVGEGFLTVDVAGVLFGSQSAVAVEWFGPSKPGQRLWEYLADRSGLEGFSAWLELGWSSIEDDLLPLELTVDQLPKRFARDEREYEIEYRPVLRQGKLSRMIVVISDVTVRVASEREGSEQREFASALDRALRDRSGFTQFVEEITELMSRARIGEPALLRTLHTIKGNCAAFGLARIASTAHHLETRIIEGAAVEGAELRELTDSWSSFTDRLQSVFAQSGDTLQLCRSDYLALRAAVEDEQVSREDLARMIRELLHEPVALPLERAANQARALSERLGKSPAVVTVQTDTTRIEPRRWRPFWASFGHAVRNAIDHGFESDDERIAEGKSISRQLRLSATATDTELEIALADDGRGIDWDRIAQKAAAHGLNAADAAALREAIFADGVSSRDEATEISGRGVGMGALRDATLRLGGRIEIDSERMRGTTFRFLFPVETAEPALSPCLDSPSDGPTGGVNSRHSCPEMVSESGGLCSGI